MDSSRQNFEIKKVLNTKKLQTEKQTSPPSEVVETLWKVQSVLNRTEKIIKKFSDFYFSSYHRKLGWFFQQNDTKMTKNAFNNGVRKHCVMCRMWKIIKKFSDFYFLSHRENSSKIYDFIFRVIVKIHQKLTIFRTKMMKNDHNSKNKNRKNLKFGFYFYSADSGSFTYIWPLLKKKLILHFFNIIFVIIKNWGGGSAYP